MTNLTLDEVYVSPYERKRGRPKKYNTPEEALEARRKTALKYYYVNFEHCKHLKKLWLDKKIMKKNRLIFFLI